MIQPDNVITLSYTLRTEQDGPVVEATPEEQPLVFISGHQQTLPLFEANILLKKAGDDYSFKIVAESAYGERNEEMVVELEKEIFSSLEDSDLVVGNEIPMADSMGRHLMGKIVEVNDNAVVMDFNHPLAGKDLYFSGKIIDVRPATEEELAALHKHSCGGNCGNCGGGCGHDHGDCGHDHGSCGHDHDGGCGCGH